MAEQDRAHWWFIARRRILADQIAALRLPQDARILEIGCGPGGNLEMLSAFGHVDAMELDDEARRIAGNRSRVDVRPGRLPNEIPYDGGKVHPIAALDVIEHVGHDAASVEAIAAHPKPRGIFVMTVPACKWMWSSHDAHHHDRRYTPGSVRAPVAPAGLTVLKRSYFDTLLFALIALFRLAKSLGGASDRPDDDMPGPITNAPLTRIFGAERILLRSLSLPFGVSVLSIARRNP
jgi:SAM-dependent methyltransferase